ncbi:MAG: right-handed parallel beta-helix repeat-containing protein [Flavicella sp.]
MKNFVFVSCVFLQSIFAKNYYVSKNGNDANSGSFNDPFLTIQRAVKELKKGDVCYLRKGTYLENIKIITSGNTGAPIQIKNYKNEKVCIDGRSNIVTKWLKLDKHIYKTTLPKNTTITQLFSNDRMLLEARWPNSNIDRIWERSDWATSGPKSNNGIMYYQKTPQNAIDWSGGYAMLNISHQYKTWSRKIHTSATHNFTYKLNIQLETLYPKPWNDDYFYLFGKKEALDSPGEWYFDHKTNELFLYLTENSRPEQQVISYKKRDYGMETHEQAYIHISGIHFMGCTVQFKNCNNIRFENCTLSFPTYNRLLTDNLPIKTRTKTTATEISGHDNKVSNIKLSYSNTIGLLIKGSNNTIENCTIHDINWVGSVNYPAIKIESEYAKKGNTVKHCTVYNTGNVGILSDGPDNSIEYNDVYNTALACKDAAGIQTQSPRCSGTEIKYNWIHDTDEKGIRGDDQTRNLHVHHNVLWNCGKGMLLKGDDNWVYNNTILGDSESGALVIPTKKELKKWWTIYPIRNIQNKNSYYFNNLVAKIVFRKKPLSDLEKIENNYQYSETSISDQLNSITQRDFRPKKDTKLIEKGIFKENHPKSFNGNSPDIGAYEYGEKKWIAGVNNLTKN